MFFITIGLTWCRNGWCLRFPCIAYTTGYKLLVEMVDQNIKKTIATTVGSIVRGEIFIYLL